MKKLFIRIGLVILPLIFANFLTAQAAPPVSGQSDCGIIQGTVFYSNTYAPPGGTPASSGTCSWVRLNNTVCATSNYGGTTYNLYPHRYVCNMPLDDWGVWYVCFAGCFGFYILKRKTITSAAKGAVA